MKKIKLPNFRVFIVPAIVLILCIAVIFGVWSGVKTIQVNQKRHEEFRSNIENLYYYLKNEPIKFEMFAVLNKGDSVALSAWNNYISTADDTIKKYEKQFKNMQNGILPDKKMVNGKMVEQKYVTNKYPEYFLVAEIQKNLTLFKEIRVLNQNRIEMKKGFDETGYQNKKKELTANLIKFAEDAKKAKFDLR